jgi:predicted O-linked N-acetylglucosamine transferase (SPINDLY family)
VQLPELIAPSKRRYVELCAELAGDLPRLAEIRRGLRGRMENSPLTDAAAFTLNLENAYRRMWQASDSM